MNERRIGSRTEDSPSPPPQPIKELEATALVALATVAGSCFGNLVARLVAGQGISVAIGLVTGIAGAVAGSMLVRWLNRYGVSERAREPETDQTTDPEAER